jgi:deoxyribose-phosphate aldolase
VATASTPNHAHGQSELARLIDHTLLKPTAVPADFERLCDEAIKYGFWSVCIPPANVRLAVSRLGGSSVKVGTVVGFPFGYNSSNAKIVEARQAIQDGADEIDMVMNIGAFKGGDHGLVSAEIRDVTSECKEEGRLLKVIIECCYLTNEEKVTAARLAESMGANFVKTSTGFGTGGATVEDVSLIRRSLAGTAKVKASGGVDSLDKAFLMLKAGADRLGTSSSCKLMKELTRLNGSH